MDYQRLDNEELIHLSLEAMSAERGAEAVAMLKTLVERDPDHAHGRYLLAAQHAQLGMMARAEEGFRAAVRLDGDFPMSRFQLGQLLLLKGEASEAREVLAPLRQETTTALSAYAGGLCALAEGDPEAALGQLRLGLERPQPVPALAEDMLRLVATLEESTAGGQATEVATPAGASLLLSNYGRQH